MLRPAVTGGVLSEEEISVFNIYLKSCHSIIASAQRSVQLSSHSTATQSVNLYRNSGRREEEVCSRLVPTPEGLYQPETLYFPMSSVGGIEPCPPKRQTFPQNVPKDRKSISFPLNPLYLHPPFVKNMHPSQLCVVVARDVVGVLCIVVDGLVK